MEEVFKCSRCKLFKPRVDFSPRPDRPKGIKSSCIQCTKKYYKSKYKRIYKEKYKHKMLSKEYKKRASIRWKKSTDKTNAKIYSIMYEYKNCPCKDCGECYPPYVMDFDHINSDTKLYNISRIGNFRCKDGLQKLLEEIKKCEVVCSNCHRIRTHNRKLLLTDKINADGGTQDTN